MPRWAQIENIVIVVTAGISWCVMALVGITNGWIYAIPLALLLFMNMHKSETKTKVLDTPAPKGATERR